MNRARIPAQFATAAALLLLTCFALPGCGVRSFNREWRAWEREHSGATGASSRASAPPAADDIAGLWEGTWSSDANGHSGKLYALVKPVNEHQYELRFLARFFGVLRYGYTVTMTAEQRDGRTQFNGEHDLGNWGGVFHYTGHAHGEEFVCTFTSENDRGEFRLHRPGAVAAKAKHE